MVGHATHIVYVDVTLTRSNIKVTDLLKFRRTGRGYNLVIVNAHRPQQAVRAGSDDCQPPCGAFWLHPVFATSRVQYISDLRSKFALRPHHVWKYWKYGRHAVCNC